MSESVNEHNLGSYMDRALALNTHNPESNGQTAQSPFVAVPRRPRPIEPNDQKSRQQMPPPVPNNAPPSPPNLYTAAGSPSRGSKRIPGYIPQKDSYNITGASRHTHKTVDAQGKVEVRTIRKGVEDFEFANELGAGSYSTVVAASDKQTLRQYAIKILDKVHIIKEDKVKYVEIEKNTLNRLGDHPGIIQLYYTFQDRASLFFVLDYAPNGELLHLIKRVGSLDIPCSRYYTAQLLDAAQYMHDNGVIHRDLKPENILLDYKMRIKITDFGTAKLLDRNAQGTYPEDVRANSFVGTAEYVSPELLTQKYQGKSADVWAIGCVLYQMIAGTPPFQGSTQYLTFQRIVQFQYKVPPGFPYLVRDLLQKILVSTRRRWTIPQIKQHALFEGVDWSMKALWGEAPPKIQPYKPSADTMAAPPGANIGMQGPRIPQVMPSREQLRQGGRPPAQVQAQRSGQRQPQPSGPSSLPNQRTRAPSPSTQQQQQQVPMTSQQARHRVASQPRPGGSGTHSASAAAAALYRRPPQSAGYSQGQERLQAMKKQVMEQRPSTARGPSEEHARQQATRTSSEKVRQIQVNTSSENSPRSPRLSSEAVGSPTTPSHLPLPPVTALEQEWSAVLTSRNERILKIDNALIGTMSSAEGEGDSESKFVKLFSSKKKARTIIITTFGRLLLLNPERKVKGEVIVGAPQVRVRRFDRAKGGLMYIVDTYTRTFTLENLADGEVWNDVFELSKRYYDQMQMEAERSARGAATAAAIAVAGGKR